MTEEHNIFYLFPPSSTLCSGAVIPSSYPQIITLNASAVPAPSMTISISEYNSLLDQFMARGDEITRLQAVIRNVTHYLTAKQDVQGLSAVEDALLLECERAMEAQE